MSIDTSSRFDAGNCLWSDTAQEPAVKNACLQGDISTDVLVVGGGLTGTRTALGLAERGVDVTLIDARHIAWGASGRSGGQCNPIWRITPDDLRQRLGPEIGNNLIEKTMVSANTLFDDIGRYGIACDPMQAGWLQAAHSTAAAKSLEALQTSWVSEGAQIKLVDGSTVSSLSGADGYHMGLLHGTGGHIHPLSLTRGFARHARAKGAQLHDETPALSMVRNGNRWRIKTPQGSILCDRVVVATNAYTGNLVPSLQRSILPMVSVLVATEPLQGNALKAILKQSVTISDSRRAILFGRLDRDNRLIFGCMGSSERMRSMGGLTRLLRGLFNVFPALGNTRISHQWAGRIAMNPDLMPHFHEPAPGLTIGLGYTGRGVVNTSMMANAMVARMLGAEESTLPYPITKIRNIPFHSVVSACLPLAAPILALRDAMDK